MADEHLTRRPPEERPDPSWGPTTEHGAAPDPSWPEPVTPTGAYPPPAPGYGPATDAYPHPTGGYGHPTGAYPQPIGGYGHPTGAYPHPTDAYPQRAEGQDQSTQHLPSAPDPGPDAAPPAGLPRPPRTDELPLGRRVVRKVRRGDQRDAVLDAVRTVEAKLHPDFRVAIATGVLAIAAVVVQQSLFPVSSAATTTKLIGFGLALAFLVLGLFAVRRTASETARLSSEKGGRTAAAAIKVTTLLVGYVLVALITLGMLDVRLGNLLVGGALTGVVIGIAAQQALGNVFAGLVLLFSRPYVPGEHIRVNAGALGGPHDGVVVGVGLTYTVLLTDHGPLNIPNSGLLGAAIGPQPPAELDPTAVPGPPVDPGTGPKQDVSPPTARGGAPTGGPPA